MKQVAPDSILAMKKSLKNPTQVHTNDLWKYMQVFCGWFFKTLFSTKAWTRHELEISYPPTLKFDPRSRVSMLTLEPLLKASHVRKFNLWARLKYELSVLKNPPLFPLVPYWMTFRCHRLWAFCSCFHFWPCIIDSAMSLRLQKLSDD